MKSFAFFLLAFSLPLFSTALVVPSVSQSTFTIQSSLTFIRSTLFFPIEPWSNWAAWSTSGWLQTRDWPTNLLPTWPSLKWKGGIRWVSKAGKIDYRSSVWNYYIYIFFFSDKMMTTLFHFMQSIILIIHHVLSKFLLKLPDHCIKDQFICFCTDWQVPAHSVWRKAFWGEWCFDLWPR